MYRITHFNGTPISEIHKHNPWKMYLNTIHADTVEFDILANECFPDDTLELVNLETQETFQIAHNTITYPRKP
jgi:hypothetical protein